MPLSSIFESASDLKRAYEFFGNAKTSPSSVCEPYHLQTAALIKELPIVLAVGDTSYLDYKKIVEKREEYGPIGNGGNGLILHSALAVNADNGQPMGLLWEKLWHREHLGETVKKTKKQKKKQQAEAKKRPIKEKESYKWIEAVKEIEKLWQSAELDKIRPKIIHVFDREGDIAEVFDEVSQTVNRGVVVRAAHNRAIEESDSYLWQWLPSQPIKIEVDLTVAWAIESVAHLGGYLSHRRKSNIGITVLWRGFLELQSLCEGWQLRSNLE